MSRAHARLHARRWQALRRRVFKRDEHRCVRCGKAGRLECDHIVPLDRRPGQDPYDEAGLQSLCRDCHIAKTREENTREPSASERAWRAFRDELM